MCKGNGVGWTQLDGTLLHAEGDSDDHPSSGSSLQPRGTSVYRARIPAGTTLYHARYDNLDRIPSPEWFAFDIELSC